MFGLFSTDPTKKLQKQIKKKYEQSIQLQRNGKLREYGVLMKEIEELEQELEQIRNRTS